MTIDEFVRDREKEVKQLERDLYDEIMAVVAGLIMIDGKVVFNEKNMVVLKKIDKAIDSFIKKFQKPYFRKITSHLGGLSSYYDDYFSNLGLDVRTPKVFSTLIGRMENYLADAGVLTQVRHEVKRYLLGAISQGRTMGGIRSGLRNILGLGDRSGVLNRYYRAFIFDSMMQFDRIVSLEYAKENGLEYFKYKGGLIETSRDFCIARDGLVFRKDQADEWKDDPTLPGYPDVADYDPLIDLGRWNCRHYLLWLTKEEALNEEQG